MMGDFDRALAIVLQMEGGFVRDPRDPGGATNYGITLATLQAWRHKPVSEQDVRTLGVAEAGQIYRANYWAAIRGNDLPWPAALMVFDAAVNQGVGAARLILQSAVGANPDGQIGIQTLAAVTARSGDPAYLVRELGAHRAVRYARGDMTTYGLGWMRRLFHVALQAMQPA